MSLACFRKRNFGIPLAVDCMMGARKALATSRRDPELAVSVAAVHEGNCLPERYGYWISQSVSAD